MMETLEEGIVTEDQMNAWDSFVESHPRGSIYHTSNWGNVVNNAYGHQSQYFALFDKQGKIVAGLPVFTINSAISGKRYSSVPCGQTCTPLVQNFSQYHQLKQSILDSMRIHDIQSWELKTTAQFLLESGDKSSVCDEYGTYVLPLENNPSALFRRFHKSCIQRSIGKAKRIGLEVKRCRNRRDLKDFFRLYLSMRKKEGLLPQPRRFFDMLWDSMFPKGRIEVLYAVNKGRVISTILLLRFKDIVSYEYGATEYGMQNTGASPFLIWEAIRKAAKDNYRLFDFGRTGRNDSGLKNFKRRWGASLEPFVYYSVTLEGSVGALRQRNKARILMATMVHMLPLTACALAGRLVYRHLV